MAAISQLRKGMLHRNSGAALIRSLNTSYYEGRINEGGIFLAVHADQGDIPLETARDILYRNGGHSASRERMASAQ